LLTALKKVKTYEDFIERYSPVMKRSGLFFFGDEGLARPEVVHHRNQLRNNYAPPEAARMLLLLPQTRCKPFHKAREFDRIKQLFKRLNPNVAKTIHVCFYEAPFGVVPLELDEVYPLSQHEAALPLDRETVDYVAGQVAEYVKNTRYSSVVFLNDTQTWGNIVENAVARACLAKKMPFEHVNLYVKGQKAILTRLETVLKKKPSDEP
jgi:predicted RNA-binding protein